MGLLDMTPERACRVMDRMVETLDPKAGGMMARQNAALDGMAIIIALVLCAAQAKGKGTAATAVTIAGILRDADRIDRELTEQAAAAGEELT